MTQADDSSVIVLKDSLIYSETISLAAVVAAKGVMRRSKEDRLSFRPTVSVPTVILFRSDGYITEDTIVHILGRIIPKHDVGCPVKERERKEGEKAGYRYIKSLPWDQPIWDRSLNVCYLCFTAIFQ